MFKEVAWGFVDTRSKAIAFLFVLLVSLTLFLIFNILPWWRTIVFFDLDKSAPRNVLITHKVAKTYHPSTPEVVLFVGGSTTRELTPSDQYFSEQLSEACGRSIQVINAGSSSQSFWDSWLIAHAVNPNKLALVVVGLNYFRFNETLPEVEMVIKQPNFPFNDLGNRRHVISIDQAWLSGLSQIAWLNKNKEYFQQDVAKEDIKEIGRVDEFKGKWNLYSQPIMSKKQKNEVGRQFISQRIDLIAERMPESQYLWGGLAKSLNPRGGQVLFIRLPTSASMTEVHALLEPGLNEAIKVFESSGAKFAEIGKDTMLLEDDFFDQAHLLALGRKKIFPELKTLIINHIGGCN